MQIIKLIYNLLLPYHFRLDLVQAKITYKLLYLYSYVLKYWLCYLKSVQTMLCLHHFLHRYQFLLNFQAPTWSRHPLQYAVSQVLDRSAAGLRRPGTAALSGSSLRGRWRAPDDRGPGSTSAGTAAASRRPVQRPRPPCGRGLPASDPSS